MRSNSSTSSAYTVAHCAFLAAPRCQVECAFSPSFKSNLDIVLRKAAQGGECEVRLLLDVGGEDVVRSLSHVQLSKDALQEAELGHQPTVFVGCAAGILEGLGDLHGGGRKN